MFVHNSLKSFSVCFAITSVLMLFNSACSGCACICVVGGTDKFYCVGIQNASPGTDFLWSLIVFELCHAGHAHCHLESATWVSHLALETLKVVSCFVIL
jgi:hypothetical protein